MTLETRNVFIDTQVFDALKLNFENASLVKLRDLCRKKELSLILSETVVGEVDAHIKRELEEALSFIKSFTKKTFPFRSSLKKQHELLERYFHKDVVEGVALNSWKKYIEDCKAKIVSSEGVDASDLLKRYFSASAPFGPGRKKDEFPDAISMLSIQHWLDAECKGVGKIYVVSNDADLKRWCQTDRRFLHIDRLPELIALCIDNKNLTEQVLRLFSENESTLLEKIREVFCDSEFSYLDNWEAEVQDVNVKAIEVIEVDIIEVNKKQAVLSVLVRIQFTAEIEGPDYDSGAWDSEDKRYVYVPDFSRNEFYDEHYDVTLTMLFDGDEFDGIDGLEIQDGKSITLSSNDGYPYK